MLIVRPIQTKELQKELCEICNIDFDADCLAYEARENEKLLGVCQFRILGKYAVIYNIGEVQDVDDLEAMIIMNKAALNFIDLCGIKEAIIKTDYKNLPKILGFIKDNNNIFRLNLDGYFESPCKRFDS